METEPNRTVNDMAVNDMAVDTDITAIGCDDCVTDIASKAIESDQQATELLVMTVEEIQKQCESNFGIVCSNLHSNARNIIHSNCMCDTCKHVRVCSNSIKCKICMRVRSVCKHVHNVEKGIDAVNQFSRMLIVWKTSRAEKSKEDIMIPALRKKIKSTVVRHDHQQYKQIIADFNKAAAYLRQNKFANMPTIIYNTVSFATTVPLPNSNVQNPTRKYSRATGCEINEIDGGLATVYELSRRVHMPYAEFFPIMLNAIDKNTTKLVIDEYSTVIKYDDCYFKLIVNFIPKILSIDTSKCEVLLKDKNFLKQTNKITKYEVMTKDKNFLKQVSRFTPEQLAKWKKICRDTTLSCVRTNSVINSIGDTVTGLVCGICVREGCDGAEGFISRTAYNRINCSFCLLEHCTLCNRESHGGLCTMTTEQQSKSLIGAEQDIQITKTCPGCGLRATKNGGCNHMTCSAKSCKVNWCWTCAQVVDLGHNFSHNNDPNYGFHVFGEPRQARPPVNPPVNPPVHHQLTRQLVDNFDAEFNDQGMEEVD